MEIRSANSPQHREKMFASIHTCLVYALSLELWGFFNSHALLDIACIVHV